MTPATTAALEPITTVESLREHLQWAIELEHATLPPYLCALYSLDRDRNPEAAEVVLSVFLEEMLHLTLAANLLNAVGGRPNLDPARLLSGHPRPLPHSDRSFQVSLLPFGEEALELFLKIEKPAPPAAPPEGTQYETIGQFYAAIEVGLRTLSSRVGEKEVFSGDPERQIADGTFTRDSGRIIAVHDLASALEALGEIVEQGEGAARREVWDEEHEMFHPERDEVAHYYRFLELRSGRRYQRGDTPDTGPTGEAVTIDWDGVRAMSRNPRMSDHEPGSPIRMAQEQFNRAYCDLLRLLERTFNGNPAALGQAFGGMYELRSQAQALMQMPNEDGNGMAGPTFEYVAPDAERRPADEVPRIIIEAHGPYAVYGGVPLTRKRKLVSEDGHALNWQKTETLSTEENYALCRCGHSGSKPFCDGTHHKVNFDGAETADVRPYSAHSPHFDAEGISVRRVGRLCMHAAFCVGHTREVPAMLEDAADSDVRAGVMGRIDRCPSGSYTYAIGPEDEAIEPDLPQEIAVVEEEDGLASGLWVTGAIPIHRADGQPWES